jgi:ligand-binding SRPBCC domain-containing protein
MPVIELKTHINAAPELCFDLSLDIDMHMQSMEQTNEKAIEGRTTGSIQLGECVKWQAIHFGFKFTMTIEITELLRPFNFTDAMISGPFKSLRHQHTFEKTALGTIMTDRFDFKSPFGVIGYLADTVILESYMRKLLIKRNELIKTTAENRSGINL